MFFWNFLAFSTDVSNLIYGSSAFSKCSLNIWKFMVHVLLKPGLENFEHYFASMWYECQCAVVWAFVRRRQWHPTPVLLPGKSHGRRSLVGCSPRGREESDTTEKLHFHFSFSCIGEGNGNPLQCSWRIPGTGKPGGRRLWSRTESDTTEAT